jgi:SAM-dependent methyltransferase
MRFSLEKIACYLSCPDDQAPLHVEPAALQCTQCGRVYPVREGEIVELLPRAPARPSCNQEYALEYDRLFHQAFETHRDEMAWGARNSRVPSGIRKRERQRRVVLSMFMRECQLLGDLVLCDVSAGIGEYTLPCARYFKWVLHSDLSVDSLEYALNRSREMGVSNVFFLRVDYFALPFCGTLNRILCLDTLIRGEAHEKALLGQIRKALGREGRAIVDFHNWWHNPLRRLGLLRQNFGQNRSYARHEAERLLRECGIEDWELVRFYQECEPANPLYKRLPLLLPATRLIYEFGDARFQLSSNRRTEASDERTDSPASNAAGEAMKTSQA